MKAILLAIYLTQVAIFCIVADRGQGTSLGGAALIILPISVLFAGYGLLKKEPSEMA